jgi:hypothetical protein
VPSNKISDGIRAPMEDNETWAECLCCGRTRKVNAIRGLLHVYVNYCPVCLKLEKHLKEKKNASAQKVPHSSDER